MGILSPRERNIVKRFRQLADEEMQARIQGQWQQESPAREYLEQVKCGHDTDCMEGMMEKGFTAVKGGNWEEYKNTIRKEVKASEWAFDRIKEAFEQVAQDEAEKVSIVQEIMTRSTDYLRRIIAPVGGQGGVTMSCLCSHCNSFFLRNLWRNTIGCNRTGFYSYKQVTVLSRLRYSKHMQYLRLLCKLGQCINVVGEEARRWRRPLTEYSEEPG